MPRGGDPSTLQTPASYADVETVALKSVGDDRVLDLTKIQTADGAPLERLTQDDLLMLAINLRDARAKAVVDPPAFLRLALAAGEGGGVPYTKDLRVKRAITEGLLRLLWRCEGHGGLLLGDAFVRLPESQDPSAPATGTPPPPAENAAAAPTPPPILPSTPDHPPVNPPEPSRKRTFAATAEDNIAAGEDASEEGAESSEPLSSAGNKRQSLTYVSISNKFSALWNVLLTISQDVSSLPEGPKLSKLREIRTILSNLQLILSKDTSLKEETTFVNALVVGLDLSMRANQIDTAAIYVQDKLLSTTEEGSQTNRIAIIKQLNDINKFSSGPKSRASGHASSMQPVSLTGHFGGLGPPPAWLEPHANAGRQPQGYYSAAPSQPYRQQRYKGGGRGYGGGGGRGSGASRKPAMCGRCRDSGKTGNEIMHSFRTCPLTRCRRCGNLGHIDVDCTN